MTEPFDAELFFEHEYTIIADMAQHIDTLKFLCVSMNDTDRHSFDEEERHTVQHLLELTQKEHAERCKILEHKVHLYETKISTMETILKNRANVLKHVDASNTLFSKNPSLMGMFVNKQVQLTSLLEDSKLELIH